MPEPDPDPCPFLRRFATGVEFAAALIHARLQGEALGPDSFEWRLLRLPLPHGALQVGRNGAMAMSCGVFSGPDITVGLVVEPRGPHYFNGHDMQNGLILYREGSEFCGHSTSPAFWASVSLEDDWLQQRYASLTRASFPEVVGNSYIVEPAAGHLEGFRSLLRCVMAAAEAGTLDFSTEATRDAFEESLLTSLVWSIHRGRVVRSTDHRQRASVVRRAQEALRAVANEPPSIPLLCEALGVNERTLFYAFQEYLGMSPKRYLKIHRLTQVRHALLVSGPDANVGDVAACFGFFEPGRFAGEYRALFGELPSETLRRLASSQG